MISYEVMLNIYILLSRMLNKIFGKIDSTSIVTQDTDLHIPQVKVF